MAKDAVWSTSKDVAFVLVFTLLRLIDIDFDSMVRQTGATKPFVFSSSAQSSTKKKAQQVLFPIGVIIGALVPRRSKMVESYNKMTLFLTSNMQLQHVPMTPSLH